MIEIIKVLLFVNGNLLLLHNNLAVVPTKYIAVHKTNPVLSNLENDPIMLHPRLKANTKSVVTGEVG